MNGQSAFPYQHQRRGGAGVDYLESETGMTLRDWFAGMAITAAHKAAVSEHKHACDCEGSNDFYQDPAVAERAYAIADAMMAQRENPDAAAGRKS